MRYTMDDGMKVDALKALDSAPMRQLVEVMRSRAPDFSDSQSDLATVAMQAKLREGYELAIENLLSIPKEVTPDKRRDELESALLSPDD